MSPHSAPSLFLSLALAGCAWFASPEEERGPVSPPFIPPPSYSLRVESAPPGAAIWLGYERREEKTPASFPLPQGVYLIRVGEGDHPREGVLVTLDRDRRVRFGLHPVRVESEPAGAFVYLEGDPPLGAAPFTSLVPPGKRSFTASYPGFRTIQGVWDIQGPGLLRLRLVRASGRAAPPSFSLVGRLPGALPRGEEEGKEPPPPRPPTKYAVVVGAGEFRDGRIPPLPHARSDAIAVRRYLVDPAGGSFPPENVRLLLGREADLRGLRSALGGWLPQRALAPDEVFIYFAGYGGLEADPSGAAKDGFGKYLLPHDADASSLLSSALSLEELAAALRRVPAGRLVLVADACFSAAPPAAARPGATPKGAATSRSFSRLPGGSAWAVGDFLGALAAEPGRALLFASRPGEGCFELDRLRGGLLTRGLLETLEGGEGEEGAPGVEAIFEQLAATIPEEAKRLGLEQNPLWRSSLRQPLLLGGKLAGGLYIHTRPEGADIRLDGKPVGRTPLQLRPLPAGRHRVEAEKEGFLPAGESFEIRPGDLRGVSFTLRPPPARLVVETTPPGARVQLNGEPRGQTPLQLDLGAGDWLLRLEKEGYGSITQALGLLPGTVGRFEAELSLEPWAPQAIWYPGDPELPGGGEMVFVPAGWFLRGGGEGPPEGPRRSVYVDAFYIDKHPISNVLYERFAKATKRPPPPFARDPRYNLPLLPAVGVSWEEARAFCLWAGKRLPTEAEWEKAARGVDGRAYPWGEGWRPDALIWGETARGGPAPLDRTAFSHASPYGARDMAGNVWEWVEDWYSWDSYLRGPARNPKGPEKGPWRVLRGGSWGTGSPWHLRTSYRGRARPEERDPHRGFRCARAP